MEKEDVIVIQPHTGIFQVDIKELIKYKDLIWLFVRRNFVAQYKQTILGPLWYVINPLVTSVLFTLVFGGIAKLSTGGVPKFVFYLCSNAIWAYFATCLNQTSATFTNNASIMGKVYFPRMVVPISTVIYSLVNFVVVLIMTVIIGGCYIVQGQMQLPPAIGLILVPLLVLQTAFLGLGTGIIVSSLTTKYRDLQVLITFGVSLWMYATPVVYTLEEIPEKWRNLMLINPMAPIVNNFRYAMIGAGELEVIYWLISWLITAIIFLIGVLLFNQVEKKFMDTV